MTKVIKQAIETAYRKGLRDAFGVIDISPLLISSQVVAHEIMKETYKDISNRIKAKSPNRKCMLCGKDYIASVEKQKYCSNTCGDTAYNNSKKKPHALKKCKQCKSKFTQYTTLQKFCSNQCRYDNEKSKRSFNISPERALAMTGKNNPAYRNGMYTRQSKISKKGDAIFKRNGKSIRQSLISEFGFIKCQHCDTSTSLRWEIHHIVYRSEKPNHEYLHDTRNLINLCIQCHNNFHKNKGMRNDLVLNRDLHLLFGNDILDK